MKIWIVPISLALLGGTARADQCEWVEPAIAQKARALLEKQPKVISFCEPCGDKAPGEPAVAHAIDIRVPERGLEEVYINGTGVDLAYTYVKTDDGHYRNLALLAGCPATDVSPSLAVDAETPNGVLITADDQALPPPPPVAPVIPTVAIAPVPPPPPAPPAVYVYSTTTHDVPWLALAVAAGAGALGGSLMTLLVLGIRRRRDMRPRAADLR